MIRLDAVLETFRTPGFTAWPVAVPAADRFLTLSGQMAPAEVGTAMAVIFEYADIPVEPTGDLHHLLDRHLVKAEALAAPGGLRVRDLTGHAEILPGCCCGLENWREWYDVLKEEDLWLGHDPDTALEYLSGRVRLRQGPHEVEIRLADLPALLDAVHRQLQGFLGLVHAWAGEVAPQAADRIVAVLDENFAINRPL